ncbi:metallophosphoesterase family protein [Maribacter sp. MAR_2009_72]|uniref:metallophosphoesterase family protein n=1 Tax=Maribacter sp. MAR_2009_72 TaxID=1250050 RepID=UPI0011993044|nr:metallophosphoesterase [Maribacter sp. MAR_2009_72]TVZ14888.1 calcineurin-like phosphoesterase family protein [Maribacter sp. MAR_2009_72]
MNIVHFSDIHLSKENHDEFCDNFRGALIKDLLDFHRTKNPIDLIIITGDLVDRGGHSLVEMADYKAFNCPFQIFEEIFINPIAKELGISKNQFLFIPGNHDIDEKEIFWVEEKKLKENITSENLRDYLDENDKAFNSANYRIKKFKEFEKRYHAHTPLYKYSNNQSTFIYEYKNKFKVGFILINDSWRCSTCEVLNTDHNKHFFGTRQFYSGMNDLEKIGTDVNVCLFHHPLDIFEEKIEAERFLVNKRVDFFLYGHSHKQSSEQYFNSIGGCYGFKGRASLNKPGEPIEKYQVGYQIFELNLEMNRIQKIHYRKYIYDFFEFAADTGIATKNGIDDNRKNGGFGYLFEDKKGGNKLDLDILDVNKFKKPTS